VQLLCLDVSGDALVLRERCHRLTEVPVELVRGVGDAHGRVTLACMPTIEDVETTTLESRSVSDWKVRTNARMTQCATLAQS
jgi:hypothetical protein